MLIKTKEKKMKFRYVESDDPMLIDDCYELISNPNIYIQVCQDGTYIINQYVPKQESVLHYPEVYTSLDKAKKDALKKQVIQSYTC